MRRSNDAKSIRTHASQYTHYGAYAIVVYDHLLTFDIEVPHFQTPASFLRENLNRLNTYGSENTA